ncbi:MAG: tRNA (N(6)-L-threonylcarbamoyladenosine(37)-C(2))-methylthiotransferase MtaB [Candidatus Kryptoniota bacterium]
MPNKRVSFESLGCKLNYAETIQIKKEFRKRGFDIVDPQTAADVVVINTCTVTQSADSDCRQLIRRALRNSPNAYIVVTGCYAQGRPDELARIEGVDLVLGNQEKFRIFDLVDDFSKNYHSRVFVGPIEDVVDFGAADSADEGSRTRAFLKVQDGCDYNCSYCTIPNVRGRSRSPSIEFLMSEAKEIASRGYKEVVLSGVNVGDFGRRNKGTLIDLLRALESIEGIERFRISSIEPNLLTEEIVNFVAGSEKFCKHFHIPLQSGADEVLKKMRRRYNTALYRGIVEYIREKIPDAAIGADVIVGFPTETTELFEMSYSFIESLPLTYLHVFSYSERQNTDAAKIGPEVDPRVKKKRGELLRMLSNRKRYEFNRSHIGKIVRVLVEEEEKEGKMYGFTSNYVRVEMKANKFHQRKLCDVLIQGVSDNTCIGNIL